ncbi:MAG TPA: hypothetical protein EYN73_01855 [Chromatiaceae bacterium]|jgi:endonuclease/exonuclease/phosphatase family metal-dependent hydrolase|nr:hypothetical protein [Chromatiaceae bacterium]HIB84565.1 hypothetical protein [Chromatiaceae bacterium]HIN82135.1 hypothetical protein [Chromatiales bacterium]HIO14379.1 hypothetical protein [Chromatiales bacterium]HIO53859.1 hypothetical protein [Chromatiales bacterium]
MFARNGVSRLVSAFNRSTQNPPPLEVAAPGTFPKRRIRVASYNIQVGIDSGQFRHYLTRSWRHVLPSSNRTGNLDRIAMFLAGFDVVGLQEVDGGSLRSGFVDQTEYLARKAGFHFWHRQTNRNLGKLAQNSNALLSRVRPASITDHKLPGMPGRGVLIASYGVEQESLRVCVLHLSLSRRGRERQTAFVAEIIQDYPNVIVLGDLNCSIDSAEIRPLLVSGHLRGPTAGMKTFPSWRPQHAIDHILISENLQVEHTWVPNYPLSDHLPVAVEVVLPSSLAKTAR